MTVVNLYDLPRSIWRGADLGQERVYNLMYISGKSYMGECRIKAMSCRNKEHCFRLRYSLRGKRLDWWASGYNKTYFG